MSKISAQWVHNVCCYLRDEESCNRCPATIQSEYGPGTLGCYALAEEMIETVLNAKPAPPQDTRESEP